MVQTSDNAKLKGFAVCLTYHLPNVSGLTLSADALARYVHSLGYQVKIITSRVPEQMPAREIVDGIEVIRSRPLFRLGKALFMPTYLFDLWRSLDDIAVVNVHLPCLDAATVAIVAKLRRRKLVISYISSMSKASPSGRLMRAVASVPHVIAGLCADVVQVVSDDYAERSTFCRLFKSKLKTAPLPIWLKLFPGESCAPRKNVARPKGRTYRIGYVGRIARQKTLELVFDAIPFLKGHLDAPFAIDLVGPASDVVGETYWRDVLSAAEASGGTVRYHNTLRGEELAALYRNLDVLILPSIDRLESFGLVQVEAMLRRVPVVASDLPGMRVPVARTGMGKLFEPGNPQALATALVEVLSNGPDRELDPEELDALFGDPVACAPYLELLQAV